MTEQKEKFVPDNPHHITHLRAMKTLHKKNYIGLFSGALPHPIVSLPPHQYAMLSSVGIDPNNITDDDTYCSLSVYWEGTGKFKKGGNEYISATKIVGDMHDPALEELKIIKFLLTILAEQAVGGHEQLMEIWRDRHAGKVTAPKHPNAPQKPTRPQKSGDAAKPSPPTPPDPHTTTVREGGKAKLKGPNPLIRAGDTVMVQGKDMSKKGKVTAVVEDGKISVEFADGETYDFDLDRITLVEF